MTGLRAAPGPSGAAFGSFGSLSGLRTIAGLTSLFLAVMFLALMVFAVAPALLPGWGSTVVLTGSMAPALRPGDVVAFRPEDASTIGPGTIVVFTDDTGRSTVHRVVDATADGLVTRGDANAVDDPSPVTASTLQGAAVLVIPWAGLPRLWWDEGRGYLSVLTLVVLIVVTFNSRTVLGSFESPWRSQPAAVTWLQAPAPEVPDTLIPPEAQARILARSRAPA